MRHLQLRRLTLPAVLVVALAGAACGEDKVDSGSVEAEIKRDLETGGLKVSKVECPGDIKAKKGERSPCTVTPQSGAGFQVTAVQQNDQGRFVVDLPDDLPQPER